MTKLVEIHNASFGYGSGRNFITIVSDVALSLSLGEFLLLVGPNGCGKSTIIRGIFDLVTCAKGTVQWHISQHEIGYIPQESNIDHDIPATALDVVCSAQPAAWSKGRNEGMVVLESVGMTQYAATRFGMLSGGQKRRVLLARALFGRPKLLVLDEPTVNTDKETEKNIERILMDLCAAQNVGILATTHSETWAQAAKRLHVERGTLHE